VVNAMRLAPASADLDIMREASLVSQSVYKIRRKEILLKDLLS